LYREINRKGFRMKATTLEEKVPATDLGLLSDYSIEITAKDADALAEAAPFIKTRTRVSITFLPNEDFATRVRAARCVRALGLIPVPHLSARRLRSTPELERFLDDLAGDADGVGHCFVIGGDVDRPAGPYEDALSVIRSGLLEKYGVRHVGIAGYPEGHPKITNAVLLKSMMDKQDAIRELGMGLSIVTQFGFDGDPIVGWVEQLRRRGINAPVYLGVAGPANTRTLLRFATRCGVATSAKVMGKYGLSLAQLFNTSGPDNMIAHLEQNLDSARHRKVFLHFFPFGGLARTIDWIRNFADAGRRSSRPSLGRASYE
jgi:methylenetetrahydrofolate reductase (NADPH)